jgi:hypothetical protein
MRRVADSVALAAGIAVTALGLLLLLDQTGVLELRFDYVGPAVLAAVGAVLLVAGLSKDGRGRP